MKVYSIAALALASQIFAEESSAPPSTDVERITGLLELLAVCPEDEPCPDDRGATLADGWAASMVNSINGYGCWCYFEHDHGKGKGQPQNEVDAQCKILHDGYTCAQMDGDAEGESCDEPWMMDYNEPTGLGWWSKTGDDAGMKDALRKECNKRNKKGRHAKCMQRACVVEGYFAINLFGLMTNGVKYDKNLLHSRGKFDPKVECPVKTQQGPLDKECCGDYPVRFPYRHAPGRRECCGQHTFNAEFLQCCAGYEVKLTCF